MKKLFISAVMFAAFVVHAQTTIMIVNEPVPLTEPTYTRSVWGVVVCSDGRLPTEGMCLRRLSAVEITTTSVYDGLEIRVCEINSIGYKVCKTYTEAD